MWNAEISKESSGMGRSLWITLYLSQVPELYTHVVNACRRTRPEEPGVSGGKDKEDDAG